MGASLTCMHVYMYQNARARTHTHNHTLHTAYTHTHTCMHSQVAQPGRLLFSKPLNPSSPSFAPKFSPAKTHSTVASTVSSSIEAPPLSQEDEDAWLGDEEEVGVCVCVRACVCMYTHKTHMHTFYLNAYQHTRTHTRQTHTHTHMASRWRREGQGSSVAMRAQRRERSLALQTTVTFSRYARVYFSGYAPWCLCVERASSKQDTTRCIGLTCCTPSLVAVWSAAIFQGTLDYIFVRQSTQSASRLRVLRCFLYTKRARAHTHTHTHVSRLTFVTIHARASYSCIHTCLHACIDTCIQTNVHTCWQVPVDDLRG